MSPELSSQWIHDEHLEYRHTAALTQFLCQKFRKQADIDGDLPPLQLNCGLSGWKEAGVVPSPQVLNPVQSKYPAKSYERQ